MEAAGDILIEEPPVPPEDIPPVYTDIETSDVHIEQTIIGGGDGSTVTKTIQIVRPEPKPESAIWASPAVVAAIITAIAGPVLVLWVNRWAGRELKGRKK